MKLHNVKTVNVVTQIFNNNNKTRRGVKLEQTGLYLYNELNL